MVSFLLVSIVVFNLFGHICNGYSHSATSIATGRNYFIKGTKAAISSNFFHSNVAQQVHQPAKVFNGALPWIESIDQSRELVYMPILIEHLNVMKSMNMEQVMIDEKLIFKSSSVKPARISNLCYKNDKFRKIRMTYFDAGENVQVFF
jgi:hypothetical protein